MTVKPLFSGPDRIGCPSDMEMDRFYLMGAPEDHPVARHLTGCDACRARFTEQKAAYAVFERRLFPASVDAVVARVQMAQQNTVLPYMAKPLSAFAAAAATILMFLTLLFTGTPGHRPSTDVALSSAETNAPYVGEKGALGMEVWCRRSDQTFRVHEGDTLYENDMIRFLPRFSEGRSRYAMVISRDAAGNLTQYAPESGNIATLVPSGEALPGSVVLDDVTGSEALFLLAAKQPFRFEDIADIGSKPNPDGAPHPGRPHPPAIQQTRVVILKAPSP